MAWHSWRLVRGFKEMAQHKKTKQKTVTYIKTVIGQGKELRTGQDKQVRRNGRLCCMRTHTRTYVLCMHEIETLLATYYVAMI